MKVYTTTALATLSAAGFAAAHMEMMNPPPLRSKYNKFSTNADFSMTSPLDPSGANFPCKGYLSLLGSPQAQSVASWAAGSSQSMTITGGANHNGGSCQASLSFDNGKSWKVIHSWIGNCPTPGESKWEFTIPSDTPAGPALFAWSWFNQVGNREMYMNCAAITVTGSGKKKRGSTQSLASRPDMFVANLGNGCSTTEGSDLMFPNPGPDVDMNSKKIAPPVGSCSRSASNVSSPVAPAPSNDKGSGRGYNSTLTSATQQPAPSSAPNVPNVNNGQNNSSTSTTAIQSPFSTSTASFRTPSSPSSPTNVPGFPSGDGGACIPGAYSCSSDLRALQVCDVSKSLIRISECGAGQVCKFNESNKTPYCVPQ